MAAKRRRMNGLAPAPAASESLPRMQRVRIPRGKPAGGRLADALESVLPRAEVCCRTMASREEDMHTWALERFLEEGVDYAVQWARVTAAVQDWRSATGETGPPPVPTISSFFRDRGLPTAVASAGSHSVIVRLTGGVVTARMMSPQEAATLLGLPSGHRVRRGLRAVSGSEGRRLCGQSVNVHSAAAVAEVGLKRGGIEGEFTVGVAGAGIAMVAAGLDKAAPGRWSYEFFVEEDEMAVKAHRAAWGEAECGPTWFEHVERGVEAMPYTDFWQYSPRCAAFSMDNRGPPADVEPTLAEMQAALRYVSLRRPRVVVIEETAGLAREALREERLRVETMLRAVGPYSWVRVDECPTEHAGAMQARPRLWFVGWRRR